MALDRNAILNGLMSQYQQYSTNTSGVDVKKVLKFGGRNFDIRQRSDISTEVVVFKYENGLFDVEVDDDKPTELNQNWQVLVYVEQGDSHSIKEARYERFLNLCDDLVNWSRAQIPANVDNALWTVTITSFGNIEEEDGYLSCEVNFQSRIDLT